MPRRRDSFLSSCIRTLTPLLALAAAWPRAQAQAPIVVAQIAAIPKSPGFRMDTQGNGVISPELNVMNKLRAAASAASAASAVASAPAVAAAQMPVAPTPAASARAHAPAAPASAHVAAVRASAAVAAAAPPSAAASAVQDPFEHLRQRLAETLGATAPSGARYTMQVANRGESGENVVHSSKGGGAARRRLAHAGVSPASSPAESHAQPVLPPPAWDYAGPGAPEAWARLRPDYARCANGQRQSPIDIRGGIAVDLEPIRVDYRPSAYSVTDTGHTVRVDVDAGNAITVMGRRYELQEFHFHRPAEERVDGHQYDMDVQLVHRSADGHVAVIAVLLDQGAAQPVVQAVWNNLPLEKYDPLRADAPLDPAQLLPSDRRYYTYMGSLTTPPCDEGVLWMVMQKPVSVSAQQVDIFTHLYPMNARPLQQADGRLIKQSN